MKRRIALELLLAAPLAYSQDAKVGSPATVPAVNTPEGAADYVCPMDLDIRSAKPGVCPRCGMKLVLGIPDGSEYPMELSTRPRVFHAGDQVELVFRILDPKSGKPVQRFEIVHERLFHMFIVSQDLQYFLHDHPTLGSDNVFRFNAILPKGGVYRILGDFYPFGATPQLIAKTLIVPVRPGGSVALGPAKLQPSLGPCSAGNTDVELITEPLEPISGQKTLLFFKLKPSAGMEKYLGAWGHMLAASDDLIDMIHTHPFIADGGPQEQFNVIFPRARTYRVWVQFQREGVVNTAAFNIPVSELK